MERARAREKARERAREREDQREMERRKGAEKRMNGRRCQNQGQEYERRSLAITAIGEAQQEIYVDHVTQMVTCTVGQNNQEHRLKY